MAKRLIDNTKISFNELEDAILYWKLSQRKIKNEDLKQFFSKLYNGKDRTIYYLYRYLTKVSKHDMNVLAYIDNDRTDFFSNKTWEYIKKRAKKLGKL